jgi:hypothetical protein
MRFEGTDTYIATPDLMLAVNAAVTLERPLLVKGEPGTGKTMLAEEVARSLKRPLVQWHIKSTTKAQQGLYEYDAVSRLRDSQLGDAHVGDIAHYIKRGVLWEAFESESPAVVLIDEVDKADIEFPNDLLRELDPRASPSAGSDHQQQRERAAGRIPSPLFFSLHPVSRQGDDDAYRRRSLSGLEKELAQGSARSFLRAARRARIEKEAIDFGAARLVKTLAGRGHSAGGAAQYRQEGDHSAAARCVA